MRDWMGYYEPSSNSHTGIDHCAGIVVTLHDSALRSRFRQGFVPHELPLVEPLGIWCNLGEFTSARLEYHPYNFGISWVYIGDEIM